MSKLIVNIRKYTGPARAQSGYHLITVCIRHLTSPPNKINTSHHAIAIRSIAIAIETIACHCSCIIPFLHSSHCNFSVIVLSSTQHFYLCCQPYKPVHSFKLHSQVHRSVASFGYSKGDISIEYTTITLKRFDCKNAVSCGKNEPVFHSSTLPTSNHPRRMRSSIVTPTTTKS